MDPARAFAGLHATSRVRPDSEEHDARFAAIVEYSSELVVVVDTSGAITYISPSVAPLLGYEPADVSGVSVFDFLHPDDVEDAWSRFLVALEAPGIGIPFDVRIRAAGDRWTVFEIVASNMRDNPYVGGIVFHGRDVTERFESQRRFQVVFEQSPVALAAVHPDGASVVANHAFAELFCSSPDEMKTRRIADLVHPDDRALLGSDIAALRSDQAEKVVAERRYLRGDGTVFHGRATISAVRDVNGVLEYMLGTIADITDERRAADAIAASESRFRTLVDKSPDMIVVVKPDGSWFSSERGTKRLGYSADTRIKGGVFSLIHPDDLELAITAYNEVLAGTRPIDESVELRFRTATGEYLPFECVGQNLGDHEAVGGVAITARDLTERKRIEAALSAAEARFQAVFEHAPFSVSVVNLDGIIIDVNYAGCSMVGVPREELIGSLASDTVHPDDLQGAVDATTRQLSGADDVAEFRLVDRGGGEVWVMSSASLIDPGNGQEPYLVTIQADITERRLLEDRLAHEATRDPLTGVFNRGAFVTQLELALTRRGTKPPVLLF
ncbi:MAG: domain S-box/diguanylate cyclase protein, partial [Actinomycetia bacterium]|nr:domain S-box/diguanylate cyclase protein [Actinomycetes bacterium]